MEVTHVMYEKAKYRLISTKLLMHAFMLDWGIPKSVEPPESVLRTVWNEVSAWSMLQILAKLQAAYGNRLLDSIGLLEVIIRAKDRDRPEVVEEAVKRFEEEGLDEEFAQDPDDEDLVVAEGEDRPELTSRVQLLFQPVRTWLLPGFTHESEASDRARVAQNGVSLVELVYIMMVACHVHRHDRFDWKKLKAAADEFQRRLDNELSQPSVAGENVR